MESEKDTQASQGEGATREGRTRRRSRGRRVIDHSVPSPCISVCTIDDATGQCLGCRRTIDEIRDWPILSRDQKLSLLDTLAERRGGGSAA